MIRRLYQLEILTVLIATFVLPHNRAGANAAICLGFAVVIVMGLLHVLFVTYWQKPNP